MDWMKQRAVHDLERVSAVHSNRDHVCTVLHPSGPTSSPTVTISNASGVFYREKAEEWRKSFFMRTRRRLLGLGLAVKNQADVAQRILHGMSAVTGQTQTILHRPLFIFWFMGQINRYLITIPSSLN